jgi:glycerate 2-kinase
VQPPQDLLMQIFRAAVAACHPDIVVPRCLPPRPDGRVLVLGTGKASAAMAAAVETCWDAPLAGTVVTRYGHGAATRWIKVIEAQHPVPDAASRQAGGEILSLASGLSEEDTVLVLLSGGGSALMAAPLPSLDLETKQSLTRQLVLSGASISQINCVRKHLSAVKGGRLAARAFPARTLTIAISDVANDDPSVIASGPTVADPSTQRDALEILKKFSIDVPPSVQRLLEDAALETPKPGDPRLSRSAYVCAARGSDLISAACDTAHRLGIRTMVLGLGIEGDARRVARAHAEIALSQQQAEVPLLLLSGGELTVSVTGPGSGGPNREYLLAMAQALRGADHIWVLAADSDGIDGSDDIAGGWIGPETLVRAGQASLDPDDLSRRNDSAALFRALGQEIKTGPTRTNVNDFRAILILPQK